MWFPSYFLLSVFYGWSDAIMNITELSHVLRWENLHNRWWTNTVSPHFMNQLEVELKKDGVWCRIWIQFWTLWLWFMAAKVSQQGGDLSSFYSLLIFLFLSLIMSHLSDGSSWVLNLLYWIMIDEWVPGGSRLWAEHLLRCEQLNRNLLSHFLLSYIWKMLHSFLCQSSPVLLFEFILFSNIDIHI